MAFVRASQIIANYFCPLNAALSVYMKLFYSASIGVLTTLFTLLFIGYAHFLRLDFAVAPKVELCRSMFNINSCDLIAYFFVMCMEIPQVLSGLLCSLITILVVGNYSNKIKLSNLLIACSFFVSYVIFFITLYSSSAFNIFIYIVVTAVIYSLVLLLLIKGVIHLTSHLKGQKTVGLRSYLANFSQPFMRLLLRR